VYRPGCKADSCLTLEGPQGKGKSRAARILGGEWFTDEMADIGSKDSAMQALGVWIVELAELTAVKRSEKERVKAFITRQFDRFRPPYGKHVIQVPRQCVFLATTNDFEWNNDETGARRFWPVRCGEIDLDTLGRDRDQLWAEALDRYRHGAPWWLEGEDLILSATTEQCDRYDADPWQASIEEWAETKASVTMEKILADCLEKPRGTWTQSDKNRIARCLRALNWEKKRFREGKSLGWEYRRVES
jgi:putative DNA primase/helicase